MTEKEVLRYLELVDRKITLVTSGINWKPEYEGELANIDEELKELRVIVDKEQEKRLDES